MNTQKPHIIDGINELKQISEGKTMTCLTGMRPTGKLHLGHYVGALKNWIEMEKIPNIRNYFLIADYQALGDYLDDPEKIRQSVKDIVIDWLSVGLDPKKSCFIVQSYVPEFAELAFYLNMFATYSEVMRNPTLKDEIAKIEKRESNNGISIGFINYPVSQVADILLPRGEIVPVGEDQIPHIELARKIIDRVNKKTGTDFPLPKALLSDIPRLTGIDGKEKMSKSLGNAIMISDSLPEIRKKVQKMYTDPNKTSVESEGNVENHVVFMYLDIFYEDKEYIRNLKKRYTEGGPDSIGDGELKQILVATLDAFISPIREKRTYYEAHLEIIKEVIDSGATRFRTEAKELLLELRAKMKIADYGA
ncbi:MAG: tryptophan--tRNA ligase [Candidatus Gracilibacteria bacterium]|nr:tryptophan--tRNA ligase [Candidatus Gracilibacteria bacterium]